MTGPPLSVRPLAEVIAEKGRLSTAKLLGCTGPALANALSAGRTIFVAQAEDGSAIGIEVSRFPGKKRVFLGSSTLAVVC